MRMSAIARYRNSIPKEKSKTQQEKRKNAIENYRPRVCCKRCKETKKTLYRVNKDYCCKDCMVKGGKRK